MYLIVIHVPIFVDGSRTFVATEWLRSVCLLRDSFKGHFGDIHVLAPSLPASQVPSDVVLEAVDNRLDGVQFTASINRNIRARDYWLSHRNRWLADVRQLVEKADVVHGGFADPFRPMMFDGLKVAFQMNRPTVAYRDTDSLAQFESQARESTFPKRVELAIRSRMFARMAVQAAQSVDLLMLKGQSLMRWLAPHSRNARSFHDTSYLESEIVRKEVVESRVSSLGQERPLRLVYCGRLVNRKGVDDSLKIIHAALRRGANYELDIIGGGPQLVELEELVRSLGISSHVRFLGSMSYGAPLIARLAEYDGMLFTPKMEDTPRMIFDGYAAGLPLIATGIPYVLERENEEQATVLLPMADIDGAATRLSDLWHARQKLGELARRAHEWGHFHAADRWYERRANWTIDAVERHQK